jgi:hypothetical protein
MLEFKMDGIMVEIGAEVVSHGYNDARMQVRTRFERQVKVHVQFWDFICRGNFHDLSLIKSSLLYFMQGYWKRSGKDASRIDLATEINWHHFDGEIQTLHFAARQKNKKNFLHISLERNESIANEVYLDGQQVLMLDIAIGKALYFLTPTTARQGSNNYDY